MPENNFHFNSIEYAQDRPYRQTVYSFHPYYHPYIGDFIKRLNKYGMTGLFATETQSQNDDDYYDNIYTGNPENSRLIDVQFAARKVDFSTKGAYSFYNRELFFEIPIIIANQLRVNQRFADAQKWFHYVFDPTTNENPNPDNPSQRYWKFQQFRENSDPQQITDLLINLSDNGLSTSDRDDLLNSIEKWKKTPFSPHEVAKFRPIAYQLKVVMDYLSNLIEWGDSLFRQFTIETINEAEQMYILASNILGEKPQEVPRLKKRPIRTYKQIKNSLDEFGNILVEMESEFPLNTNVSRAGSNTNPTGVHSLLGVSRQLYFCIPENKKLLGYWDLVADRLYKIRNCMDIEGNVRPLPLFQPRIDPGMLVKAAAGGMSLSSIVGGLNLPVSQYRFNTILGKAIQLCGEVKSLGGALLSAFEKGDGERLSIIRQEHEVRIQKLSKDIRYLQWKEAESATEALVKSRESAYQRYRHYQTILGKEEAEYSSLEEVSLDRGTITEENFDDRYAELVGQFTNEIDLEDYREDKHGVSQLAVDVSSAITGAIGKLTGADDLSDHFAFNVGEKLDLNVFGPISTNLQVASMISTTVVAPLLSLVPQFDVHGTPLGVGGAAGFGGTQLSRTANLVGAGLNIGSTISSQLGSRSLKVAGYQRRVQDWIFQNNLAAKELQQLGQQLIGALIREQIAKKEYENHEVQIEHSEAIEVFLKEEKFSNESLYLWMQNNLSQFYNKCYKLAYDYAKQAEATLKHEVMRPELDKQTFIQFNYQDTGRKGLLAGETLHYDLLRMEKAYLDHNKREYELTKSISLSRLNPIAILQLKATGTCEIELPEWLFDLDKPAYMRRIKSLSISIPCIAGPNTSINCTVSLLSSTIRTRANLAGEDHDRLQDEDDPRFRDFYGTVDSIVTSSAQNDSGLFELNLRDERFLPFENSGAISKWRLELPSKFRQFDYDTINDVVFNLRYTARSGGATHTTETVKSLETKLAIDGDANLQRVFTLQYDAPNEWHRFTMEDDQINFELKAEHFPYFTTGKTLEVTKATLFKRKEESLVSTSVPDTAGLEVSVGEGEPLTLSKDAEVLVSDEKGLVYLVVDYGVS